MKILRLDLIAVGPFARQSLSLAEGSEGLHIVYGPNEAGKSSALRALRALLYGFGHATPDAFRHPYKDLRVGALLRDRDGSTWECIRRKGLKHTLRGPADDRPLDETRLTQLLAGVNEGAFGRQFGIDHAQLVAGGEEIVAGRGEMGQILFAAAAGFACLNEVRRELAAEAEALYTPAAAVKPINRALNELRTKRQAVKEAQLSSSEWKRHRDSLAAAEARKTELEAERQRRTAELVRLQRIGRALPDIGRRNDARRELERLRDVPALPPDFSQRRRQAEQRASEAELRRTDAAETLAALQREMATLDICAPVLDRGEFIERLHKTLAVHLKAEDDSRSRLVPQRDQLLREAAAILRDLGRDPDNAAAADELRLTKEERRRIQRLGSEYAGRLERVEQAQRRLGELRASLAATEDELRHLPSGGDVAPLRRALDRARRQGDLEERCRAAERDCERQRRAILLQIDKLPLWSGTLEALESLPLPSPETVAVYEQRLEAAHRDCEKLQAQCADVRRQVEDLDERLRQLDLQHDVPTEAALAAARRQRDEGWRLVRALLRDGNAAAAKAGAQFAADAGAETLAGAYERCVQAADDLADRLRREAERVGEKSQLLAQRDKQEKRLAQLTAERDDARQRYEQAQDEWRRQWQAAQIEPLSPREMREWLARHGELVAAAEALRRQAEEAAALRGQTEHHRRELRALLSELGAPCEEEGASLDDLAAAADEMLKDAEECDARRQHLERDAARQRRELEAADHELAQARDDLEGWRSVWAAATCRLHLHADAAPTVANEILNDLDDLFAKIREAESLTARIEAIAADAWHFAQNVANVCEGAAPDLAAWPYAKATVELYRRWETAKTASARRAALQKQQADAERRRSDAEEQGRRAQAELEALCREAGCTAPNQLLPIEEQASRQRALRERLEEIEQRLRQEAAARPLEAFVEEALREDADQLAAAIERLEQQLAAMDQERDRVHQAIGEERKELEKMDGNARAAAAQEDAEQLLAQLRDDAERYVRLRLAAEVLHGAIQRHRERNQGPVLGRASELFRQLTLGSFAGLKVDYDDGGQALLVGVRDGGATVSVGGMSDGSCDQLYLALRLASLEHYLDHHPPLPFIVDDILITFDDDRAAAALRILAALSRRTQVIFFTHHRRLVELAKKLPKHAVFLHQLPNPLAPDADAANGPSQPEKPERSLFA